MSALCQRPCWRGAAGEVTDVWLCAQVCADDAVFDHHNALAGADATETQKRLAKRA